MQYLYIQFCGSCYVASPAWKCFRCDLTFKEEDHAKLHEEISNHRVRSIRIITV